MTDHRNDEAPTTQVGASPRGTTPGTNTRSSEPSVPCAPDEIAGRLTTLDQYIEQAARRLLQQIFTESLAAYWERRADEFEAARAKPGDYHPPNLKVTEAERAQLDEHLASTARACRRRAQFIREQGDEEAAYMVAVMMLDPLAIHDEEDKAA